MSIVTIGYICIVVFELFILVYSFVKYLEYCYREQRVIGIIEALESTNVEEELVEYMLVALSVFRRYKEYNLSSVKDTIIGLFLLSLCFVLLYK